MPSRIFDGAEMRRRRQALEYHTDTVRSRASTAALRRSPSTSSAYGRRRSSALRHLRRPRLRAERPGRPCRGAGVVTDDEIKAAVERRKERDRAPV